MKINKPKSIEQIKFEKGETDSWYNEKEGVLTMRMSSSPQTITIAQKYPIFGELTH